MPQPYLALPMTRPHSKSDAGSLHLANGNLAVGHGRPSCWVYRESMTLSLWPTARFGRDPVVGSLFFLFTEKVVEGRQWVAASGRVFCLIRCFVFILNLCIFLEMLRCQLMNGGQKTPPLCHDHIVAALYNISFHPIAETQINWT